MNAAGREAFTASRQRFEALCTVLDGDAASGLEHGELEARVDSDGRELLRQLTPAGPASGSARALRTSPWKSTHTKATSEPPPLPCRADTSPHSAHRPSP